MEPTLVSIITPTYNSEEFISETMNSIINQTYQNWELLITDDCSNDNTVEIVKQYILKDKRIKLFELKDNSGAGVARNNSIKNAKGRYIAFCDSDDLWKPHKLKTQLEFLDKKKIAFTFSAYDIVDNNLNFLKKKKVSSKITYSGSLFYNQVGCLTAIYDSKILGKVYMSNQKKRQDYHLWLTIMKRIKHTYVIDDSLALYRLREHSISSNKLSLLKYNYRVYTELGYSKLTSLFFLIGFLLVYIFKKIFKNY